MTEIRFATARPVIPPGPSGLQDCPGRNDPRYGAWMIAQFCDTRPAVVVDPMCGGGQLWMLRPADAIVQGCEINQDRVQIARENGIAAEHGEAETWAPSMVPDLVGFSFPYRNCNHDSGKGEHQRDLVASKGLQSMQAIEQVPCFWRVFAQIATYCGTAPVAVIVRNYIRDQVEVDWVSEVAGSMAMAGLGEVERYWRTVKPGPTEQWKLARGEYLAKTGKAHRVIDREWVLVGRLPRPEVGA